MPVRHTLAAALLVAGIGALAAVASTSGDDFRSTESVTGSQRVGVSAPTDPGGPKTRVLAPAGVAERQVEEALATGASAFVPVPAYRMYDSRFDPLGKWLLGDVFYIDAVTNESGHPQIPDTAAAVTFNVTVTQTERAGYVQVFGPGTAPFGTSTINWVAANIDVANSGSVQLGPFDGVPGYLRIAVGGPSGAATHVIVDITGYYEELPAD